MNLSMLLIISLRTKTRVGQHKAYIIIHVKQHQNGFQISEQEAHKSAGEVNEDWCGTCNLKNEYKMAGQTN